jgi:hypothetical protein
LSKNETTKVNSKDIFSTYQENVDKMLNIIKKSVPRYHQSITNVEQEYLQAFENMVGSSISLQKEFVTKTGITSDVPTTTLKIIDDTSEEFVKSSSIQNQIVLASIDTTQQNIRIFNDNVESFVNFNKNILQSCISAFSIKK